MSDAGDLVLAKAAPDAYTELARAPIVLDGKCWNSVAIGDGHVIPAAPQGGRES